MYEKRCFEGYCMLGCDRGYLDGSFFSEQAPFRGGRNFPLEFCGLPCAGDGNHKRYRLGEWGRNQREGTDAEGTGCVG